MSLLKDLQLPVPSLRRPLRSLLLMYDPKRARNPQYAFSLHPNHVRKPSAHPFFRQEIEVNSKVPSNAVRLGVWGLAPMKNNFCKIQKRSFYPREYPFHGPQSLNRRSIWLIMWLIVTWSRGFVTVSTKILLVQTHSWCHETIGTKELLVLLNYWYK
jgi:hypothetical protein